MRRREREGREEGDTGRRRRRRRMRRTEERDEQPFFPLRGFDRKAADCGACAKYYSASPTMFF
eukprot:3336484-Pyramimonas_sp.AAC.1